MDFSKTIFSTFLFWYFLFLEAVVKAALFVVGEVGAIQVVINPSPVYLRHLRLVCQSRRKKYTPTCRSKPERQTSYLSFSVFVFYRWLLHARFINTYLHLSDCMACNQIFYFFIRICLFSVYLHLDAVFTISHPLVVPVQAQR